MSLQSLQTEGLDKKTVTIFIGATQRNTSLSMIDTTIG